MRSLFILPYILLMQYTSINIMYSHSVLFKKRKSTRYFEKWAKTYSDFHDDASDDIAPNIL